MIIIKFALMTKAKQQTPRIFHATVHARIFMMFVIAL